MLFTEFKKNINTLKKTPLGGLKAQFRLAPIYRKNLEKEKINALKPIFASVLIIFFPNEKGETSFILTKRASYKGHHSKQISFPGGKKEVTDIDLIATAIRETHEEIGIEIQRETVFKELTDVYIPPSNFLAHPFLSYLDTKPIFTLNHEVDSLLLVSLKELLNSKNTKTREVQTATGQTVKTPCYLFENQIVWGATAMMLSELTELFTTTFSN
ncbi:MAG TPA: CoA pyrophosphatase [Lutibacter sp.]|nr:CoA pyrophosphatase [Lutibacter sp.]